MQFWIASRFGMSVPRLSGGSAKSGQHSGVISCNLASDQSSPLVIMPDQPAANPAIGEVQMLANGIQYSIHGARVSRSVPLRPPCMRYIGDGQPVRRAPHAECPKKHARELQTVFRGLDLSGAHPHSADTKHTACLAQRQYSPYAEQQKAHPTVHRCLSALQICWSFPPASARILTWSGWETSLRMKRIACWRRRAAS